MLGPRRRLRVLRTSPVASSRRPIASGIQSASPVNGSCELVTVGLAVALQRALPPSLPPASLWFRLGRREGRVLRMLQTTALPLAAVGFFTACDAAEEA